MPDKSLDKLPDGVAAEPTMQLRWLGQPLYTIQVDEFGMYHGKLQALPFGGPPILQQLYYIHGERVWVNVPTVQDQPYDQTIVSSPGA